MRSAARLMLGLALVAPALLVSEAASAQAANMAHTHIGHVADRFGNTPANRGLLATAIAEAEVAAQHAELAGAEPDNLAYMKQHTGHVLHAIDPSVEAEGPALGYGVKQAATAAIQHIEMAADFEGASTAVDIHAAHIATAARNVVTWCDELIAIAQQIQAADEAEAAAELIEQMAAIAGKIASGHDADGDGQIGWQEGEGGLRQAEQHATLLKRAEGLGELP
jgi:hypothetical protein